MRKVKRANREVALRQEGIAVSQTSSKKIVSDQKITECIVFIIDIMDNKIIAIQGHFYEKTLMLIQLY